MRLAISNPAMKKIIITSAIISAFVALSSCEKHEWEDTKRLHVDKAEHGEAHGEKEAAH